MYMYMYMYIHMYMYMYMGPTFSKVSAPVYLRYNQRLAVLETRVTRQEQGMQGLNLRIEEVPKPGRLKLVVAARAGGIRVAVWCHELRMFFSGLQKRHGLHLQPLARPQNAEGPLLARGKGASSNVIHVTALEKGTSTSLPRPYARKALLWTTACSHIGDENRRGLERQILTPRQCHATHITLHEGYRHGPVRIHRHFHSRVVYERATFAFTACRLARHPVTSEHVTSALVPLCQ